ncbi:MAG: tRNA lysidine(34) synthetase TilS, partial [Bacilli bacterium]|nr:tRNA lysidine(34) synthetase TilS [Bacilli bacterium]
MKQDVIEKINNLSDEYVIIGVSAGPDSMALLHLIMNTVNKKIVCAHINHNVRKQSNEEEKYLKKYCKDNNIIFKSMKITSYNKGNFENEARIKRYAFYESILKKYNSHTLLLAHHGDDLMETVLMKIIRGSNLEGYAGIKTYSKQKDYLIIRPLLNLTKEDIIKYNKDNKIKYFIDDTNTNDKYTRNRIRLNILPMLKKEKK